jgi:hypothetical protein
MTTSVKEAEKRADAARRDVEAAEAGLTTGHSAVSADDLHKLRDNWRHADLSAQGARQRAEQDRRDARLKGLAAIGEEAAKLASSQHADKIAAALRNVTAAVGLVRALAAAHDADVAELARAAQDLGAEPKAPGGPRATSAYVAVEGKAVLYKRSRVAPIGAAVEAALGEAISGDPEKAIAGMRPAREMPHPHRPDHLLRHSNGTLHAMDGILNDGIVSQIRTGDLTKLSDVDVDRYMAGELG